MLKRYSPATSATPGKIDRHSRWLRTVAPQMRLGQQLQGILCQTLFMVVHLARIVDAIRPHRNGTYATGHYRGSYRPPAALRSDSAQCVCCSGGNMHDACISTAVSNIITTAWKVMTKEYHLPSLSSALPSTGISSRLLLYGAMGLLAAGALAPRAKADQLPPDPSMNISNSILPGVIQYTVYNTSTNLGSANNLISLKLPAGSNDGVNDYESPDLFNDVVTIGATDTTFTIHTPIAPNHHNVFSLFYTSTNLTQKLASAESAELTSFNQVLVYVPTTNVPVSVTTPTITAIGFTGERVTLTISNLTTDASNAIQRAVLLASNAWGNAGGFLTTSNVMAWSEAVSNAWSSVFYRVRCEQPFQ